MTRKDNRTTEVQNVIYPPAAPRKKEFHCITLRPGETEDDAFDRYDVKPIHDGDVVFILEYVDTEGRLDPIALGRP